MIECIFYSLIQDEGGKMNLKFIQQKRRYDYDRQIRPGFSAKRYLSTWTKTWDDNVLEKVISKGKYCNTYSWCFLSVCSRNTVWTTVSLFYSSCFFVFNFVWKEIQNIIWKTLTQCPTKSLILIELWGHFCGYGFCISKH